MDVTKLRAKWSKDLQITKTETLRIYDLMEWCDACSLLLCECRLQPENRKLEISMGPDKKTYHLMQTSDESITIEPWPFEISNFFISFEYRNLMKLQFESSADLRKTFLKTNVEEQVWKVERKKVVKGNKKI